MKMAAARLLLCLLAASGRASESPEAGLTPGLCSGAAARVPGGGGCHACLVAAAAPPHAQRSAAVPPAATMDCGGGGGLCCSSAECLNGTVGWSADAHGVATFVLRRPSAMGMSEGCLALDHRVVVDEVAAGNRSDLTVSVGFGDDIGGEAMPSDEEWAVLDPLTRHNGTQLLDSLVRVIFLRVRLGNATESFSDGSSPPRGGLLQWGWRAAASGTCLAAPKFAAKDSSAVLFALLVDGGVLLWVVLAVSLNHVLQGDKRAAEEWRRLKSRRRRLGLVRRRQALPADEDAANAADAADAAAAARRGGGSSLALGIDMDAAVAGLRYPLQTARGRKSTFDIDAPLSRFAQLARISIMTDAGDAHLQSYESQVAVAKAKNVAKSSQVPGAASTAAVHRLSTAQRDEWRRTFLRDNPFLWWLRALQLPLRGSQAEPGVREVAGGRAVLYLEFLAALAQLLGGCCIMATLVLLPVLGTASDCPIVEGSAAFLSTHFGGARKPDLLCLLSAANVADGDAMRLWALCILCLLFAGYAWWISSRTILRKRGSLFECRCERFKRCVAGPTAGSVDNLAVGRPIMDLDVGPEHVPFCAPHSNSVLCNLAL